MINNIPVNNDSTMIWDISDNLYSESRTVSTMPRSITNGYVVKFKDTFYMVGGSSDASFPSYKYVNGEWVVDTVLGAISILKNNDYRDYYNYSNGGVVANDNNMYITTYATNSYGSHSRGNIITYNGTSKTDVTQYFGYYNSGYYRRGNIGISASGTKYKTISYGEHTNANYPDNSYGYGLRLGSTSGGSTSTNEYKVIKSYETNSKGQNKYFQPLCQGVYFEDKPTFIINIREWSQNYSSSSGGTFYDYYYHSILIQVDDNGNVIQAIELPDCSTLITDMVNINNYIYITYSSGVVYRYGAKTHKWEKVDIGSGSLVLHDGEIHKFYDKNHTAHKLYRTAKTYAPKGTKIYLPYETSATSTNLQPIEGGFIVTESGNIELKIYDY